MNGPRLGGRERRVDRRLRPPAAHYLLPPSDGGPPPVEPRSAAMARASVWAWLQW